MELVKPVSKNLLPFFTTGDVLPVGDYSLTIEQLRASHLVTGEGNDSAHWDAEWRKRLVDNLEILTVQLWMVYSDPICQDNFLPYLRWMPCPLILPTFQPT